MRRRTGPMFVTREGMKIIRETPSVDYEKMHREAVEWERKVAVEMEKRKQREK